MRTFYLTYALIFVSTSSLFSCPINFDRAKKETSCEQCLCRTGVCPSPQKQSSCGSVSQEKKIEVAGKVHEIGDAFYVKP